MLAAAAVAAGFRVRRAFHALGAWDGFWYLDLARHGYPHAVGTGQSTLAFFPLYPLVVRLLGGSLAAAVLVSWTAGAGACLAVRAVAARVIGERAAGRVAVAFAFFPGAFILSMAYAEALAILLAAVSLYGLLSRRWLLAGAAAALATATRPNALPLVACCLVAAGLSRDRRAWRAAALAPAGVATFFLYLWVHTGSPLAWFDAERTGWHQATDFGASTLRTVATPFAGAESLMITGGLAAFVVLGYHLWRSRPPVALLLYTAGVGILSLTSSSLGGRPRFLLAAFPLLFPLAQLPERWFKAAMAVSALLMAVLMWHAGGQVAIAP